MNGVRILAVVAAVAVVALIVVPWAGRAQDGSGGGIRPLDRFERFGVVNERDEAAELHDLKFVIQDDAGATSTVSMGNVSIPPHAELLLRPVASGSVVLIKFRYGPSDATRKWAVIRPQPDHELGKADVVLQGPASGELELSGTACRIAETEKDLADEPDVR